MRSNPGPETGNGDGFLRRSTVGKRVKEVGKLMG